MNSNLKIILITAAIVILAGGIFLFQQKKSENISGEILEGDGIITISNDGFVPSSLKVKKGTSVRFINKTSQWHWPASDLHPSHSIYPEFDPKNPIGPGQEWSFIFDKVGTWNFHDHLSPLMMGTITVTE
jgi:plastocyanin